MIALVLLANDSFYHVVFYNLVLNRSDIIFCTFINIFVEINRLYSIFYVHDYEKYLEKFIMISNEISSCSYMCYFYRSCSEQEDTVYICQTCSKLEVQNYSAAIIF